MLPDGEGYDLCRRIREVSHVPVLFMSAKNEEIDKILGLAIEGTTILRNLLVLKRSPIV